MMGIKEREFRPLPDNLSLEELVPNDNSYRRLEGRIDLSFVRELVVDRYAAVRRPSIDPVIFFRLQLVMFEDIRSERQLMEIAADRLSVGWYLGYDLHEPLPDHSSLSRIRERMAWKSSGASSRRSCRCALRQDWCVGRSCSSTRPRSRLMRTSTASRRDSWWKHT